MTLYMMPTLILKAVLSILSVLKADILFKKRKPGLSSSPIKPMSFPLFSTIIYS